MKVRNISVIGMVSHKKCSGYLCSKKMKEINEKTFLKRILSKHFLCYYQC